ncbi:MAG: hypothetical protein LBV72_01650 [Tannerella sp.]|nr:hypothetical protein [Tannerella sp.]
MKNNNHKMQMDEKELDYYLEVIQALKNVSENFLKNVDLKTIPSVEPDNVTLKPGMIIVLEGIFPPTFKEQASSDDKTIGHACIVSEDTTKIIEAVEYGNDGKGIVKESSYKSFFSKKGTYFWLWPDDDKKATDGNGKKAAAYVKKQIGKTYNHNYFNKWDETEFYCSALCWRSWYEQGIVVGTSYIIPYVAPNDLISFRTRKLNQWTKSNPATY